MLYHVNYCTSTGDSILKSTSFFYYNAGTGLTPERASGTHVTTDSAMKISESYKGSISTVDLTQLQSKTFYLGEKGDEIADYSYNYTIKPTGDSILKSTSFFYYDAGTGRDPERASGTHVTTDSAMKISESYKGSISTVDLTQLQSKTFYLGEKGDEIADYSYNYTIKPTGDSILSFIGGTNSKKPTPL